MPDDSPQDLFTAYVLDVRVQVESELRLLTKIQQHMETWRAAEDDAQRTVVVQLIERCVQQLVAANITVKQSVGEALNLVSTLGSGGSS
jgi:prophage DNA circulation protein